MKEKKLFKQVCKKLKRHLIVYCPVYRLITGSTTAGILLALLMHYFSHYGLKICKTDAEIRSEILLTESELRSAKRKIKDLDFITVSHEGLPARTCYEINWDAYLKTITQVLKLKEAGKVSTSLKSYGKEV